MFSKLLLNWYAAHKRSFPWRDRNYKKIDERIFHTWICEVMSQQTLLNVVLPKFKKFISEIQNLHDLANCPEEKLRQLWQGLGYYARARNLKKGAQFILQELHGVFPTKSEDWLKVSGCGPYTASILCSICFDEKIACIDGNVIRVVSRLLGLQEEAWNSLGQKKIREFVQKNISENSPGDFNQAMMDLGATVCKKQNPNCTQCPLREKCFAFQNHCVELCPSVKPRQKSVNENIYALIFEKQGYYLLMERSKGFLAKTFGFPILCENLGVQQEHIFEKLNQCQLDFKYIRNGIKHSITKYKIQGHVIQIFLTQTNSNWKKLFKEFSLSEKSEFVTLSEMGDRISSSLDKKIMTVFLESEGFRES